ncbi:MAG TPA: tetratricopeptide repeat protein [Myxococcales bacterium]|nr:tetratricopeptide repeat protein [Myxococcales bacterium]
MKLSCPNCRAAFHLDDGRVPAAGLAIKCPKCKGPFTVQRPKPGEEDKLVEGKPSGAAPLPGTGGEPAQKGPPMPASGPAARGGGGGAVPLPGVEGAARGPQAAAKGFAGATQGDPGRPVPLPGQDGAQRATSVRGAPRGGSAVPLPGDAGGRSAGPDLDEADLPLPAEDGPVVPSQDDPFAVADDPPRAPPRPQSSAPVVADGGDPFAGLDEDDPPRPAGKTAPPPPAAPKKPARPPPMMEVGSTALALSRGGPLDPSEPEPLLPPEPGVKKGAAPAQKKNKERASGESGRDPSRKSALGFGTVVLAVLVAGLVAFGVLGMRAGRTPAGLFWRNRFFAPSTTSSATTKVLDSGQAKLEGGSFAGAREALGIAAQLLAVAPKDDEAKAFFVLCASELRLSYGQGKADWDQAARVIETLTPTSPSRQRALGAFALASGNAAQALVLLAPLGDKPGADVESVWLHAQALVRSGDAARAAQVLDAALKTREPPKLLLLRGLVARQRGNLPEAASWFEKVLAKSPGNGRALVELGEVKLASGDLAAASSLLDRALSPEVGKTLDATEEARASALRGRLLTDRHDAKGAEAAFDRAVVLDPGSMAIHAAYGAFRLRQRDYDKAARQYDAALTSVDVPAAVLSEAARAFLGANRWVEADKRAAEAVAKDAKTAHFVYVQARVDEVLGKGEEAARLYDKALALQPDLTEALVAKGQLALLRAEKDKALSNLELAMKTPDAGKTAPDHEAIGDLLLALDQPQKAKGSFAVALQLDPEDPQAHAGMGRALAALNDLAGARAAIEAGLKQTDTDAALHYQHGSLLRKMGESDAALVALNRAVQLDGKDARFHARLGALLVERGELAKAEEQLKLATLSNDKLSEGWYFLARAQAGEKKLSDALDTMKRAIEIEPDNAEYLYHLGLIYEGGQQVQAAADTFSKSIARNQKNPDAYEHLGRNLIVANRYLEAVDAFKRAADLDSGKARLWALVGEAMQQAGEVDGAIANFTRAVRQDSALSGAWRMLGIAYKDKGCAGCRAKAIDALKRAAQLDPKDDIAWYEIGYLYKDDGRRPESVAAFRKYLELKPQAVESETVKDEIYYLQEESRRQP